MEVCIYNHAIDCEKCQCATCGWNPSVEKERIAKMRGEEKDDENA